MKFGAHSYIFSDRWNDDSLHHLDAARKLGLDVFEIGVGDDVIFNPVLTRRRSEALGLELAISPGGIWPAECDLSSDDPAERAAGLAWHKRQVDLACALGAIAYSGALYGHTGLVRRRPPLPEEYERIAAGLHALGEYAQARGVAVVLEPMSHFRTHLVNRPEQLAQLLALADHPNLFALLDTYHMIVEVRDYAAAVQTSADRLWGIHACENDRGVPGGGLVPWPAFFSALKSIDFQGYVIMEAYNSAIPDFAWQRTMFHNVCPDPHAFVTQGLSFLKQGLASEVGGTPE
jgi:D-psicose/D-tagatose/L-ribulose 3-epimerase